MRGRHGTNPFLPLTLAALGAVAGVAAPTAGTTPRVEPTIVAVADDDFDAAIRCLENAVESQPRGDHLALILALRQLGDESLRPLFLQLVQHLEWQVQVHAVLGLAELDLAAGNENATIDPWLAAQVQPPGHESLVSAAIDDGLIGIEQMRALLRTQGIAPMARALLHAELHSLNEDVDLDDVRTLAEHPDVRAAGLASCLLMQLGDATAFSAYRTRLDSKTRQHRLALCEWLFDAVGQYKFDAMKDWIIAECHSDSTESDPIIREAAVFALLRCAPEAGRREWTLLMNPMPRYARQVRLAMLYVGSEAPVTDDVMDVIGGRDSMLDAIMETGAAFANGNDAAFLRHARTLIEMDHLQSTNWLLHVVREHRPSGSSDILDTIIDRIFARSAPSDAETALVIRAASLQFEIDPDRILSRLTSAKDDSIEQQILLLSMFTAHDPRAGTAAADLRRIGTGRADSLALTLMARHQSELTPIDIHRLAAIAGGGGRVSAGICAQAAWLYLRHSDQIDAALSQLVPQ